LRADLFFRRLNFRGGAVFQSPQKSFFGRERVKRFNGCRRMRGAGKMRDLGNLLTHGGSYL
jgi:hypothetical protein